METIKGKDLEFISWIKRDGSGTVIVEGEWDRGKGYPKPMLDEYYNILPLSLSKQTYIAHGFNSWVVKLKNQDQ